MSYLIKLQPSPLLFDSVLNNSKHGTYIYSSLPQNFHRSHMIAQRNSKELSSYIQALKTFPLNSKSSKSKNNILDETVHDAKKGIRYLESKPTRAKRTILYEETPATTKKFQNNYRRSFKKFKSTFSYDPNWSDPHIEVERILKECDAIKKSTSSYIQEEPEELRNDLVGSLEQTIESTKNVSAEETPLTKKVSDAFKNNSLFIEKTNEYKSWVRFDVCEAPEKKVISDSYAKPVLKPKKDYQKDLNFENFSDYLSPHLRTAQKLLFCLDICITNDSVLKGLDLIKNLREKRDWRHIIKEEYRSSRDIYNLLLHGLSEKGKWNLMQCVTQWMTQDNIKMDTESFAAFFYCLAEIQSKSENSVNDKVRNVINELFYNNISLDDIFAKARLSKEKLEKILALIQRVIPSYDIQPVIINLGSDCPVVKTLQATENNLESPIDNIDIETMKEFVEEQLSMEKKFLISVKAVSRGFPGSTPEEYKNRVNNLKQHWRQCLNEALEKALNVTNTDNLEELSLNLCLSSLPRDAVVDVMMDIALNLMQSADGFSPTTLQCSSSISHRIYYWYQIRKKLLNKNIDNTKQLFNEYLSWYLNPSGPARNSRQKWQMLIQTSDKMSLLDTKAIKWPDESRLMLGKFLLDLIIKELKFPSSKPGEKKYLPIFFSVLRYRSGQWREEIKCHPQITNLFQKLGFETLYFTADRMPMVCPPKPWKSVSHGGYLFLPSTLIRKSFKVPGKVLRLEDIPLKVMYPNLDALNMLQAVPWTINEKVLDLALEIFRNGGSKKLGVPHFPSDILDLNTFEDETDNQEPEFLLKKKLLKKRREDYSLWAEALYRLSLANHFRKKIFWLPQNFDFRGRVYPIPGLLNHLGSDLYRSLLIFGKGKPLGPKGLDWLKIHVINLTGTHKRKPVLERLSYANEILPLILDSAEKPFQGSKWWMDSDEPWQTLATCMEIREALSAPNPENFVSKFPIHQDGSCNGLQHYAALGKDLIGAESVNLTSLNTPQDVYSSVVKLIEEERIKDAVNGNEVAKILEGFIERKVIKQTVMTTVYGVTLFGARLQIRRRLQELENFPEEYLYQASSYLTRKTFYCLRQMFTSAREIQDWFVKCADKITFSKDYVQWVTPMGLPVLQSYGRPVKYGKDSLRNQIIVPDRVKQKHAFPPNFIHSLDSTHMMLTGLFCEQAGVTFASVHDCFWTHPISVDLMNKICREQFISLHSQPILENLSQFFIRQYLQNDVESNELLAKTFEKIPQKGSFDIKEVLNSVYFFS